MREVAISIIFITFVFCSLAFAEDRQSKCIHNLNRKVSNPEGCKDEGNGQDH
jgi:hypothetical protein